MSGLVGEWQRGNFSDDKISKLYGFLQFGFYAGLFIGGYRGGNRARLQFMAENQHAEAGIKSRPEQAAYWRKRNAHIVFGSAKEGFYRGMQLGTVAGVFGLSKMAARWARREGILPVDAEEVIAGLLTGSLFALAGKGQRTYCLQRGLLMGGVLGLGLLIVRKAAITQPNVT